MKGSLAWARVVEKQSRLKYIWKIFGQTTEFTAMPLTETGKTEGGMDLKGREDLSSPRCLLDIPEQAQPTATCSL